MDKLKVGDRIVLKKFCGLRFAVVTERRRDRVCCKIRYVEGNCHVDPARSDPVTWTHVCEPD